MTDTIIYFQGAWTVADARHNPRWLFVFNDNVQRAGYRGQAVIRQEPNAVGIPTKKTPRSYSSAFYRDEEYEWNCKKIQEGIEAILAIWLDKREHYDKIVLSAEGLSGGLSDGLDKQAPLTHAYLTGAVYALLETIRLTP